MGTTRRTPRGILSTDETDDHTTSRKDDYTTNHKKNHKKRITSDDVQGEERLTVSQLQARAAAAIEPVAPSSEGASFSTSATPHQSHGM